MVYTQHSTVGYTCPLTIACSIPYQRKIYSIGHSAFHVVRSICFLFVINALVPIITLGSVRFLRSSKTRAQPNEYLSYENLFLAKKQTNYVLHLIWPEWKREK